MSEQTNLNDRHLLEDCLLFQRYLADQYNKAALEAFSEDLKSDLLYILSQEHEFQSAVFRALHKRGWYQTEKASLAEAEKIHKLYTNEL